VRNELPSSKISPLRNPVKYFTTAMKEMPIGSKSRTKSGNAVAQPVAPRDSISLDTPTGPPTPELAIYLAQAAERQGNVPMARQHYQRALTAWPGNVEVLRQAARMEDRLGQFQVAENLYRQAAAANPQHAGALNDLALCVARQGHLEMSVQILEQAIQIQPDKPLYRNNVATVLVELRQDQKALAHLAAVHGSAEANYNFGQLLVQRGRAPEAAPYFIAALEQNPNMPAAQSALAALQGPGVEAGQPAVVTTTETVAPQESVMQQVAPETVPQQASPVVGPQFGYPATAQSPDAGASSYVPPRYYGPVVPYVQPATPRVGTAPRYLPPVTTPPGTFVR
jgi:tetratricopeptide (TPR) repeat protein